MKKVAVITGIGRGIGSATAKKFLKEGWAVIGTYAKDKPTHSDADLTVVQLDVTDSKAVQGFVNKLRGSGHKIDLLVNNAGVLLDPESETDAKKIRATFDVNIFGLIDLTERLLPIMSDQGHIISISSRYGSFSEMPIEDTEATGYRMSKAALNMYTRLLAHRLKERGITVSALHPGWVDTRLGNLLATSTDHPDRTPEDAAQDIFQLASSKPETGQFWFKGKRLGW